MSLISGLLWLNKNKGETNDFKELDLLVVIVLISYGIHDNTNPKLELNLYRFQCVGTCGTTLALP